MATVPLAGRSNPKFEEQGFAPADGKVERTHWDVEDSENEAVRRKHGAARRTSK